MQHESKIEAMGLTMQQKVLITITSVAVPAVVVLLFYVKIDGYDLSFLPAVYATINGLTAISLIAALVAIRNQNRKLHERLMKLSIAFSLLFLLGYVLYHMTSATTVFGDVDHDGVLSADEKLAVGSSRVVYLFLLASHIFLSVGIIPMVLVTYVRGITRRFVDHKKIGKITWPIWLYIAVTGVIIYLMISPYYI
ncbi:MAG TPA: DUF420 domain-containing protein [Luteibaculaceae bacterium]|nr:DUF420 domain-containing protein [Luteibaculaceae bacterium]